MNSVRPLLHISLIPELTTATFDPTGNDDDDDDDNEASSFFDPYMCAVRCVVASVRKQLPLASQTIHILKVTRSLQTPHQQKLKEGREMVGGVDYLYAVCFSSFHHHSVAAAAAATSQAPQQDEAGCVAVTLRVHSRRILFPLPFCNSEGGYCGHSNIGAATSLGSNLQPPPPSPPSRASDVRVTPETLCFMADAVEAIKVSSTATMPTTDDSSHAWSLRLWEVEKQIQPSPLTIQEETKTSTTTTTRAVCWSAYASIADNAGNINSYSFKELTSVCEQPSLEKETL